MDFDSFPEDHHHEPNRSSNFILLSDEEEQEEAEGLLVGPGSSHGSEYLMPLRPLSSKHHHQQQQQYQHQHHQQREVEDRERAQAQQQAKREEEEACAEALRAQQQEREREQQLQAQAQEQQRRQLQAQMQAEQEVMLSERLPKPWSADDVNPVCCPPAATQWLLPPTYTTSTRDAAEAIEAAAALANWRSSDVDGGEGGAPARKVLDLRKMSRWVRVAGSFVSL